MILNLELTKQKQHESSLHSLLTASSLASVGLFVFTFKFVSFLLLKGRRGVFTGVSGLQVAYVSGREAVQEPAPAHCFSSKDLAALVEPLSSSTKFRGVDILLTSQWPRGVWQYAQNPVTACAGGSEAVRV